MADNKNVIKRIFDEIVNQGKVDVADELFAKDYVDHGPTGELYGREAFKTMVRMWLEAVPDVHCEVSHLIAEGDSVAWVVRATGTHTGDSLGFPATGRKFDTLSANLGIVRNGQAVEHWAEQGMLSMLQQLGVIPAMGPPLPAARS